MSRILGNSGQRHEQTATLAFEDAGSSSKEGIIVGEGSFLDEQDEVAQGVEHN